MFTELIWAFASILLVSSVSLVGVFTLGIKEKKLQKILIYFVSFSTGALIGDVFIHLLPELIKKNGLTLQFSLWILGGITASFVLEKVVHWHHCHANHKVHHHEFATMNLVGDSFHNFIDGLIIVGSFMVSVPVGLATTLAVILHEIPQEIGDFAVLLHGGFTKSKALLFNVLTALFALLGGIIAVFAQNAVTNLEGILLAFAAGNFIYIAGSDLIPELHKEIGFKKAVIQLICMLFGIVVMLSLLTVG